MKIDDIFAKKADNTAMFKYFYVYDDQRITAVEPFHWTTIKGDRDFTSEFVYENKTQIIGIEQISDHIECQSAQNKTALEVKLIQNNLQSILDGGYKQLKGHKKIFHSTGFRSKYYALLIDERELAQLGYIELIYRTSKHVSIYHGNAVALGNNVIFTPDPKACYSKYTELEQRFLQFKNAWRKNYIDTWTETSLRDILQNFDIVPRQCARAGY
jgi:hypothetical protein